MSKAIALGQSIWLGDIKQRFINVWKVCVVLVAQILYLFQSAARRAAFGAVAHGFQTLGIALVPVVIRLYNGLEERLNPIRELWMEPVVDPLPLATIFEQAATSKLSEMTRHFRLDFIQRPGQLTNTEFAMLRDEQGHSRSGLIGQAFEYNRRRHQRVLGTRHGELIYTGLRIY